MMVPKVPNPHEWGGALMSKFPLKTPQEIGMFPKMIGVFVTTFAIASMEQTRGFAIPF